MEKGNFITDDCIIENESYLDVKEFIKCALCGKIFKKPVLCKNCQHTYCKDCIELRKSNEEGKCPNCGEESEFIKSIDKYVLLSTLKFLCNNCKEEIKYNDVESHLQKGCITNKNQSTLLETIYKKKRIYKLTPYEIEKIKDEKHNVNHLSSKKIIIFI